MKSTRNLFVAGIIMLFLSGCVVYSFYPLYTENDLFANAILIGEWYQNENDEVTYSEGADEWTFKHPFVGKKENGTIDSTRYILNLKSFEGGKEIDSEFFVHVLKLGNDYFLDFYLNDFGGDELTLATFHLLPVHTFAKLSIEKAKLIINWFDRDWLEDLITENKIRVRHENNGEYILLTAKPKELQKFVAKYVNSEAAFKDGLEVVLQRK